MGSTCNCGKLFERMMVIGSEDRMVGAQTSPKCRVWRLYRMETAIDPIRLGVWCLARRLAAAGLLLGLL
ncbi:MAG TPA: hypothetical protein PLL20_16535 [Phycisphaerae bacterium]|nr:hypothetical protein [Phycisphaerae bacterium]HRR85348.1 hypothetical protein [Phycisphaerae bacterium]